MGDEQAALARAFLERHGFSLSADGVFDGPPHALLLDNYEGCHDWRRRSAWESLAKSSEPMIALEDELPKMSDAYSTQLAILLLDELRRKGCATEPSVVRKFLASNLRVSMRCDDWLDAPVRLNLGLTVDDWSDYTANVTYPAYGYEEYDWQYKGCFDKSSIMWLTQRQGYRQSDLRKAQYSVVDASGLDDPHKMIPSPFLYSAAMEIWHELCHNNQLSFFLLVPLRELLIMWSMRRWGEERHKWPGYVLLAKETRCGFFSTWLGSGSLLGIRLERDVKVPLCDVNIKPDGMSGYSVDSVYGSVGIWQAGSILHWGLPRQFRRDARALGIGAYVDRLP